MTLFSEAEGKQENTGTGSLPIDESFPESFADTLSRIEAFNKHLFRPNTYLHKWWARRCGSTFRTILKQFVSDPSGRDYYAPGGLDGMVVLDPMMGGGTTLHEAIRMGASVIGADIDPIPVVQARAALTKVNLYQLEQSFDQFARQLYERVGEYFLTECPDCGESVDMNYALHGLRKRCSCGEVVQIDQYELREEAGRIIRILDSWEVTDKETGSSKKSGKPPLITRSSTTCPTCGEKYQELLDKPYYERYVPTAVVGTCPGHGLFFRSPGERDLERIGEADTKRHQLSFEPKRDFDIIPGPKSGDLVARNVKSYLDVFSSRQLLYLSNAISLLKTYDEITRLNLSLLVSTSLEFNALLCGYKGVAKNRPGAIRHVFALHAYSFPYTAAENNPINRRESSGNLRSLFRDRIARGRKWAEKPVERRIAPKKTPELVRIYGEVDAGVEAKSQADLSRQPKSFLLIQGDSQKLPVDSHSVDFIVTDPPYYDNVQYSDLAAFFRVWLAQLLPEQADWVYDHDMSAVATRAAKDDTNFMSILGGIFRECGRVLKPGQGRLVFTFHHWDPNAWAELTLALKAADFRLIKSHVVFSENPISIHIHNLNGIKHDSILVLALDGTRDERSWPSVSTIAMNDSEEFCRQCGAALGWLLQADSTPSEIRATWNALMRANGSLQSTSKTRRAIRGQS